MHRWGNHSRPPEGDVWAIADTGNHSRPPEGDVGAIVDTGNIRPEYCLQ